MPLSSVSRLVGVSVNSLSLSEHSSNLSFIDRAVWVSDPALEELVVVPEALKSDAIVEDHCPLAMPEVFDPMSFIAIAMTGKDPKALFVVVDPGALILGAIRVNIVSLSMP